MNIDWNVVSQHLVCPQCGEKAYINPGTDGTEGRHEHFFHISREHAMELTRKFGKPSYEDLEKRIKELEAKLEQPL